MQFFNRLYAFTKRILCSKLYIIMLASVIALTTIYSVLPDKVKETDIRVGIYFEEYNERCQELMDSFANSNTRAQIRRLYKHRIFKLIFDSKYNSISILFPFSP